VNIANEIRMSLILLVGASSILVSGCGKSDSEKLTNELKQVASWTATARMVANSCSSGAVPSAYAHRTFENLSEQLQQNAERIQSIPNDRRAQVTTTLQQIQQTVSHMYTAVRQQDRNSLTQLAAQLGDQQKALASVLNTPQTPNQMQ
jgi:hypothetical protein